jgi:hypothetical protein
VFAAVRARATRLELKRHPSSSCHARRGYGNGSVTRQL